MAQSEKTSSGEVHPILKVAVLCTAALCVAFAVQSARNAQQVELAQADATVAAESSTRSFTSSRSSSRAPDLFQSGTPRLELNAEVPVEPKMSTEEAKELMIESGEMDEISHKQMEMLEEEIHMYGDDEIEGVYPSAEELAAMRKKGLIIQ